MCNVYISDIAIKKAQYELTQQKILDWLLNIHTYAESLKHKLSINCLEIQQFKQDMAKLLIKVGCKPEQIKTRRASIADYQHHDVEKMELFNLKNNPSGESLQTRLKIFERITDEVFEYFYPTIEDPPHELIHVSCTGYVAPSSAQKIASKRNWLNNTIITHAYHMGCYGAIPAIRIGVGSLYSPFYKTPNKVDIVHTEVCSLHINPLKHEPDQLVAQSLFSDGFIKYSLSSNPKKGIHLKICAHHESLIKNSTKYMSWNLSEWGFDVFLAKEIPILISRSIQTFLSSLIDRASLTHEDLQQCYFAIHPGGPKIIAQIQKLLGLNENQIKATKMILQTYGNMSSATLPHIWEHILTNPEYPLGSVIISLAFGPGLSINGVILKKTCTR